MDKFLDSLYSRFILRDLVSKIFPGSLVISAIALSLLPQEEVLSLVLQMPFFGWLVVFSAAWTTAFAMQSIGEVTGMIKYWKSGVRDKAFRSKLVLFTDTASDIQVQQFERLIVIREACGNTYVAALLSLLVLYVTMLNKLGWSDTMSKIAEVWPALVAVALFIAALVRMHFQNVNRLQDHIDTVIDSQGAEDKLEVGEKSNSPV